MNAVLTDPTPNLDAPPPVRRAVVESLANIEAKPIDWYWRGWLARSMLTIFGGYAGDGKSTICAALAAAFSRGGVLPDGTRAPVLNSLFLSAEEDPQYALKPRLELHRADHARIFTMRGTRAGNDDDTRWTNLKTDIPLIRAVVDDHDIGVIWIDPMSSYLPGSDRNSEGDIRDGMSGLNRLMEETGVAVVGVAHVGKGDGQGRRAEQRLLGSTAITALARTVWMMTNLPEEHQPQHDLDDPVDMRKVFGVVKANYSIPPRSLALTRPLDGPIKWLGPSPIPIADAFTVKPERGEKTRDAEEWVRTYLIGSSKESARLFTDAKSAGLAEKTVRTALKQAGAKSFQLPGKAHGGWYWRLAHGDEKSLCPNGQVTEATSDQETGRSDKSPIQESLSPDSEVTKRPSDQGKPGLSSALNEGAVAPAGGHFAISPIYPQRESDQEIALADLDPDDGDVADIDHIHGGDGERPEGALWTCTQCVVPRSRSLEACPNCGAIEGYWLKPVQEDAA
jgi:hypothetical protein